MPRLLSTLVLAAVTIAVVPSAASADGFLSPYIGVNFGGDTTKKSTTYGGAIGFMGEKGGLEFDFGYTPEFFGSDDFDVDGKLVTVMANVLFGRKKGPYFAFGGGLIRTDISVLDDVADLDAARNSLGGNVGGGFFAGSDSLTVRGDVRYFRAFDFEDGLGLDIIEDTLGFWRATVGIGLMW